MVGWIGLSLLLLSYVLLITPYSKWFIPVDIVASATLTVHAALIDDIPFLIVNGFIATILCIKLYRGGYVS